MRLVKTAGSVAAALAMLGGLAAPASARALDVEWQTDAVLKAYGQYLEVDEASGDVFTLLMYAGDGTVLRRLDAATGAVEWAVPVPGMTDFVSDPTTGQVVLSGLRDKRQVVMFVSGGGQVAREVATDIPAAPVAMAVDETTGQVCSLGSKRKAGQSLITWYTSCWTSAGDAVFTDEEVVGDGRSFPSALDIDPRSHRVYAAGTSSARKFNDGRAGLVVLRSFNASGKLTWQARTKVRTPDGRIQMAIDSERRLVHVVDQPGRIESPVSLVTYDRRGKARTVRRFEDIGSISDVAVALTPRGRVLVAAVDVDRAGLRVYSPRGRLLRKAKVRTERDRFEAYHAAVAIDPVREQVHVLGGGGDTPSQVHTFTTRGKRLSRVVVDDRHVIEGDLVVHRATGRVFVTTSLFREDQQRVTALGD
ncbi:hypothetical protein [Nocardioides baculatus]|uniref:PQQ-binding-like beta-propeller repeat protein n=1 Tax=Nocardioides baculatus TaxID=2801337 RepID=A0ABS1L3J5_9ACTN|nr:hypothetical protein [Nocardioides baculatus]MBL0746259.1 hypothetical protein [Nocardioides baculatus]